MTPLSLPSALFPYDVFCERLRKLGYKAMTRGGMGGSDRAVARVGGMRVVVVHSGFGEGYGGRRPVRVVRYYLEQTTGLDEQDAERSARAVIEALIAPGPSVHAYHPSAIAERLESFWETVGSRRYRMLSAPDDWSESLACASPPPTELAERLRLYAEIAGRNDEAFRVAKGKAPDVEVLFDGAAADFFPELETVMAGIGESRFRVAAGPFEVHEREAPKKGGSMSSLATSVSKSKQQGRLTWLQADAITRGCVVFGESDEVSAIKSALKEIVQADKGGVFDVFIDGGKNEVKARKLPKMAAALGSALRSGKSVRVGADTQGLPSAELRF